MRITKTVSLALIFSVVALLFTTIPAAAAVPADKYTYTLSGKIGTQNESIEFENSDEAQNYEVVLVEANAEIKFTPKEKMSAAIRVYDPDGYYSGNMMWTINGSEEAVTEIDANKTATATLGKSFWGLTNPYYVFSFGNADDTTVIVYKISDGKAASEPETTPEETTTEPETTPETTTEPETTPEETTTEPETAPETTTEPAPAPVPAPKPTPAPATDTTVKGNTTYKVQAGDTLATIALNNYGSYKYHTKVYNANKELFKKNKDRLVVGMTLVLPADGLLAPLKVGNGTVYTVKAGDTLGKISAKYYGAAGKYTKIYEANKDRIKNPNVIFEGQKIVIPK